MREYGSEHPAVILPDGYFEHLKEYGREITYLRTGREALLYVSRNCRPDKKPVILCPAYSCWSMIAPFFASNWKVLYYPLNKDLTINEDYLEHALNKITVDVILTMNFFGSASTQSAIRKVKSINPKIKVIEDFSHCTFCFDKIYDKQVDYYVSSIRKSVGVCDGAVVISRIPTNKDYIGRPAPEFGDLRFKAQRQKGLYAVTKSQDDKENFLSQLWFGESMINTIDGVHPISERSLEMLEMLNGENIAFARKENMRHLWNALKYNVEMIPGIERCFDGAPFSLPILVNNRDDVQKQLASKGVYAPVLWPIDDAARHTCNNSAYMADNMLSLPIDQRYDWDDIEDIARIVLETV